MKCCSKLEPVPDLVQQHQRSIDFGQLSSILSQVCSMGEIPVETTDQGVYIHRQGWIQELK